MADIRLFSIKDSVHELESLTVALRKNFRI